MRHSTAMAALVFCVALATTSLPASGAIIADYAFTGASAAPTSTDPNIVTPALWAFVTSPGPPTTTGLSSSGSNAFVRANTTGSTQSSALDQFDGTDTSPDYHELSITADPGHVLDLTSLVFDFGAFLGFGDGGFTTNIVVQSDVGGFGNGNAVLFDESQVATGSLANTGNTIDLSGASFQGLSSITFRFAFYDDSANAGSTNRIDNVVLNGAVNLAAVASAPEPGTLILAAFGVVGLTFGRRRKHRK